MTSVPWSLTVNTNPWNDLQPAYPRIVSVKRTQSAAGGVGSDLIGNVGYSGAEQVPASPGIEGEVTLFSNFRASIQVGAAGRTTKSGELPGDAVSKPIWNIFIPATSGIVQYDIRDRDIITDDEGYRYEVSTNFWTGLGYQLSTVRLEA